MLWIRLWVHPYRDTISLVTETENLGYSLATSHNVGQCFRLICNGSHINTNHLICVLQPSFAVNVPMDVSMEVSLLPCYHLLTCYMAPILVSRHILVPGPGLHSIGVMIFFCEAMEPFILATCAIKILWKVFDNLTMLGIWIWMCPYHDTTSPITKQEAFLRFVGTYTKLLSTQCHAVVEAVEPFKMAPTSVSIIWNVFDNLHMLWVCRWVHLYHNTASLLLTKLLRFSRESRVLLGNKPQCYFGQWIRLIYKGSHINVKHIWCAWQQLYAVNVPMDVPMEVSLHHASTSLNVNGTFLYGFGAHPGLHYSCM